MPEISTSTITSVMAANRSPASAVIGQTVDEPSLTMCPERAARALSDTPGRVLAGVASCALLVIPIGSDSPMTRPMNQVMCEL